MSGLPRQNGGVSRESRLGPTLNVEREKAIVGKTPRESAYYGDSIVIAQ